MNKLNQPKLTVEKVANLLLFFFLLLLLISYPFYKSFIGGLVASFAAAGLIGGVADWFAIQSFFKKPLGIPWPEAVFKTEMIPKNREAIIKVLIDIIKKHVITFEVLEVKVKELKIASSLIEQAINRDIVRKLKDELIVTGDLSKLKTFEGDLKKVFHQFAEENKAEIETAVRQLVQGTLSGDTLNKAVFLLADEAQKLLQAPQITQKIDKIVLEGKEKYQGTSLVRRIGLGSMAIFTNLSYEIIKYMKDSLENLKKQSIIEKGNLREKLDEGIRQLTNQYLFSKFEDSNTIGSLISEVAVTDLYDHLNLEEISAVLDRKIDDVYNILADSDTFVKRWIPALDHGIAVFLYERIETVIRKRIAQYSNEMLIDEMYRSVGKDLNMIRINGSLVGSLVGILTFILMYLV